VTDGHGAGLDILVAVQQVIVQMVSICLGFHMGHGFVGRQVIVVPCMEMQAQQPAGQEGHGNHSQDGTAKAHDPSIAVGQQDHSTSGNDRTSGGFKPTASELQFTWCRELSESVMTAIF